MRRKLLYAALAAAVLGGTALAWHAASTTAEQQPGAAAGGPAKGPNEPLPITQVVLFNSGVGYAQREGQVEGDTRVELSFPAADVNDLLKSLVLQDLGKGKISTISYDSHDPIEKTLHSFAIDLNHNPGFGQLLYQARGERIEVIHQEHKDAQPVKIRVIIVSLEVRSQPSDKDAAVQTEYLNLLAADGLQNIPLAQVQRVRFLNPTLENEFQRALKVLASSHDTQKK